MGRPKADVDWPVIRSEYITLGLSYRELGKKYGLNYTLIGKRGAEEGWPGLRERSRDKIAEKIVENVEKSRVDRATKLLETADALLYKIQTRVALLDEETDAREIRALTASIKDLKEIMMIRSDTDIREQEARIKALEAQISKQDVSKEPVEVVFAAGDEAWNG